MPKISVVIPVYNVDKYLTQCLQSIQDQTFTDFEAICINDGSTDSSLEILKNFAANDNRFIVIDKQNEGQGVAKNLGIERALGEYLIFVDSDDWLELNALELCYNKIKKDNTDILFFNNYKYIEKSGQKYQNDYTALYKEFQEKPFTKEDLKEKVFWGSALTFKMYKTDFIKNNDIRFSPHKFMEDMVFYYKSVLLSNSLSCLNEYIYNYRIYKLSFTYNIKEQLECLPQIYDLCLELLKELNINSKMMSAFIESRKQSLLYFYQQAPLCQRAKFYRMMRSIVKQLLQYCQDDDLIYISKSNHLQFYFHTNMEKTKIILQAYGIEILPLTKKPEISAFTRRNINYNFWIEAHGLHGKKPQNISVIKELSMNLDYLFGKIDIPQIEFNLTTKCTLRCKHCSNFIPQLHGEEHCPISIEEFKQQLNNLLKSANKVRNLLLLGGEPLLVKNLEEYLEFSASKNKVEKVWIVTNGTLLLSDKLIETAKKYRDKTVIWLSNYSKNEELKSKLKHDKILKQIKDAELAYDYDEDLNWGYTSPIGTEKLRDDSKEYFRECSNNCVAVFGGKVYVCPRAGVFALKGIYIPSESETIDLNKKISKKQLKDFYSKESFSACNYCTVIEDRAKGKVIPALQISSQLEPPSSSTIEDDL